MCVKAVCLFIGRLMSQQQATVSQGRICSDNYMCCHTEIEVADQTFYLTQSQYTETRLTSSSADPITPGAWQGSDWSANFEVIGMTQPPKNPGQAGFEPTIRTRRYVCESVCANYVTEISPQTKQVCCYFPSATFVCKGYHVCFWCTCLPPTMDWGLKTLYCLELVTGAFSGYSGFHPLLVALNL